MSGPGRYEEWLERAAAEIAASKGSGNGHAAPGRHWRNFVQKTPSTGATIANLWNALLALRNDPLWTGAFRFDEMAQTQIGRAGPIEDSHIIPVHEWLQEVGLTRIGIDVVREAIEGVCREHPFHPLKDELKQCHAAWDGVNRVAGWAQTYLGVPQGEPGNTIGTMFLVGLVARIFEPGCKADYMLVLEGPQGAKKSQACEILAEKYFSDELPDLGGDPIRVSMHLKGKWLIEVAELSSFSRPDAARLKSFLSARVEQYTPKFGRYEVRQPRTCLFVGTTNEDTYLKDPTGGRRFWPLKCGDIDLDSLRRDRDFLIGEAVDLWQGGTQWWPDPKFEDEYLKPLQETRYEGDAWQAPLREYLNDQMISAKLSLMDIAKGALFMERARFPMADQKRLAALLRQEGWMRVKSDGVFKWSPPTGEKQGPRDPLDRKNLIEERDE